jgi:glycosyltransferase involved in cell wall biosynthesis
VAIPSSTAYMEGIPPVAGPDALRIVHVSDCYLPRLGGIERQVHDLAAIQRGQGHEVQVVTSTAGAPPDEGDEVPVWRPRSRRSVGDGDLRYRWSLQARRPVLAGEFDLVHIHASAFSPLAFLTAASTAEAGIPTVVTVHSLWAYAAPLFRAADVLTSWARWRLAWSAVSLIAATPLQRMVGPAVPVAILPNGVHTASWRVTPTVRRRGRVVIATVGRLAVRKRPHALLKMLERVRRLVPAEIELEVLIVGDGPLRGRLQRFVAEHDMGEWVHLIGVANHEQIRSVYASADFYVAPATLESFGIAALEARSAGLPVVAYAASGIADFIRHEVEGLLVGNDNEMVAGILRLATSVPTLERMRRYNTDNAPTVSWTGVIDQCDALYARAREIAAAGRPSVPALQR